MVSIEDLKDLVDLRYLSDGMLEKFPSIIDVRNFKEEDIDN